MKVSHRVQSTVDGFDFNSKLTDSVECSLKQPETQNSAAVTVSVSIRRGWETEITEAL